MRVPTRELTGSEIEMAEMLSRKTALTTPASLRPSKKRLKIPSSMASSATPLASARPSLPTTGSEGYALQVSSTHPAKSPFPHPYLRRT